jgi:ABC-type transport system involved in multi-copper enzyme maturation permease subunit
MIRIDFMRLGLGPVFECETSIASRRWQTYVARSILLAALLAALSTIAVSEDFPAAGAIGRYADLGESYFYAMIGVELTLVMLAAPAATAGAICLDRSRGTLSHVLATGLSSAEIILGKLAARLAPIMALVAGTYPVMAISSLLGGMDPIALTLGLAIIVAVAILGCSLALLLSVWARSTHEVLLAVYFIWALVLLAWPFWYVLRASGILAVSGHWLLVANPFYLAFAPYSAPREVSLEDFAVFFAVALGVSLVSIVIAIWRVRPVACGGDSKTIRRAGFGLLGRLSRALPGPSLDGNPVLWREWHRLRPSRWMIGIVLIVWGGTTFACCVGAYWAWRNGYTPFAPPPTAIAAGVFANMIAVFFGLLMFSVVAPTALSEERQRGSLDVLVATPLSTTAILLAKWWGTFRLVPFLAIGPGLFALAIATARVVRRPATGIIPNVTDLSLGARLAAAALAAAVILAQGAALVSLGLALATWIKRQARAIAASVVVFVLVAVGWPFLAIFGPGHRAMGLAALSPIVSSIGLLEGLTSRSDYLAPMLWWIGLWNIAAAALAIGLLWLAVRTFDEAFGRVPERLRRSHWMADAVLVVAGVTIVACQFAALAICVQGVHPHRFNQHQNHMTRVPLIPLELMALFLISVLAVLTAPSEEAHANPSFPRGDAQSWPPVSTLLGRFWRVFRLALMLAIAPISILLAISTARSFWPEIKVEDTAFGPTNTKAVMVTYTTPTGETSRQMITGDRNDPTVQRSLNELRFQGPVLSVGGRLRDAGLLTLTMLVHAAGATAAGLALGIWINRRRWRIAAAICLPLLVTFGWVIGVYCVIENRGIRERLCALSPLWVADHLLEPLIARQPHSTALFGWILAWDSAVVVFALGALFLSVRAEQRFVKSRSDRIANELELRAELDAPLAEAY